MRKERHRSGPQSDVGSTLTELLAAIMLVALMGTALLHAASTAVRTSVSTDNVAKMETILSNAADRINRAPVSCNYEIYAQAAAQSEGWEASAVSAIHQYFVPGATATDAGTWATGGCPGGIHVQGLVQLVTVSVSGPSGVTQRTIQVVKSEI